MVVQEQATDDNIVWRMRIAYWIPEATNTHTQNVSYVLHFHVSVGYLESVSVLRFTYMVCRVTNSEVTQHTWVL
jgi:hypothetical protein